MVSSLTLFVSKMEMLYLKKSPNFLLIFKTDLKKIYIMLKRVEFFSRSKVYFKS